MTRWAAVTVAGLTLAAFVSAQGLQKPQFFPPRLRASELPPLPSPNVVGGGEVLIEALVDRNGALIRPTIVRTTPPYTQFVLDAIARWRFDPARDIDYKGFERTVDMPVSIAAIYRPPILMNAPTIGEPPREWTKPSGDTAYPVATTMPNYPPNARDGGVVLFELMLDEAGNLTEARQVSSIAGFESASREALASWRFKGALYRAKPVPSTAYVLFGFRVPTGLVGQPAKPGPPKPTPVPQSPGAAVSPPSFGVLSFR